MRVRMAVVVRAGDERVLNAGAGAGAPRITRALPWVAAAAAVATVVVGLYVRRATDTPLGTPYPPFVGGWLPAAHPLLAVSVACFAAAVVLAPRLLAPRVPPWAFALAALGLTLVLRLALAAGRTGTEAWGAVFDPARSFEANNEYLPALGALDYGPRFFLDRFAELVPSLPVHAAGHPPGLLLTLHALGIDSPAGMAALCIGAGALSAPARLPARAPGARRARRAGGGAAARDRPGRAAVRRHVGRRGVPDARPARRLAARARGRGRRGPRAPWCWPSGRSSRGRCWRSAPGRRS